MVQWKKLSDLSSRERGGASVRWIDAWSLPTRIGFHAKECLLGLLNFTTDVDTAEPQTEKELVELGRLQSLSHPEGPSCHYEAHRVPVKQVVGSVRE